MKRFLIYTFFYFYTCALFSQKPAHQKPFAYKYYLDVLENAKDSMYESILLKYNAYLKSNPKDIEACLEKCRFMEEAFYDEVEEYNPKEDECMAYLDSLIEIFPGNADLLLYRMKFEYGDSAIAYCKRLLKYYAGNTDEWKNVPLWKIHLKLADSYYGEENSAERLKYYKLVMEENDTLDKSLEIAQAYQNLKKNQEAINILLEHLDSLGDGWTLNRKGKLLLELGMVDKALQALNWSKKDTTLTWSDNSTMAEALMKNGFYKEAREYLIKDTKNSWNQTNTLRKLFNYDIQYSSADSALATYRRMVDLNFMNDALGIKRIKLFLRAPWIAWTFMDSLRIMLLFLFLALFVLVPYLWVLPIHYIGSYYKRKGKVYAEGPFRWSLRHFWIATSILIITDVTVNLIFNHDNFLGLDDESLDGKISNELANLTLFGFTLYFIGTICLLKLSDLKFIWGNLWGKTKSIMVGIGYAFLIRFGLGIYLLILKLFDIKNQIAAPELSIVEHIQSINQYYHPLVGFLMVVIIVPIYEEILFRGVFLSATEKYMRFFWANALQALLFAAVHMDLKFFPFFLAFGILAGYQRQKSQSLAVGISMHMTNNLIAFLAMLV